MRHPFGTLRKPANILGYRFGRMIVILLCAYASNGESVMGKRFRVPRVSGRIAIGAVSAIAIGGAIAYGVAPSSADPGPQPVPTQTISFTADGPTPSSLDVPSGTEIIFANDVDPSANSPVVGQVSGAVKSVTVTITGVSQHDFTLQPGERANVGPYFAGATPLVLHYRSTYNSTLVAGLVPGPQGVEPGTLTIDPPAGSSGS
jgi:hypothetical protein